MRALRDHQRAEIARAIVRIKDEIPRSELDFDALGGRVFEHVPTGHFFRVFHGDATFTSNDVAHYFVDAAGNPTMLKRAHCPSSRQELEQMRAKREQRRAEREAAAKERRLQLRAAAR